MVANQQRIGLLQRGGRDRFKHYKRNDIWVKVSGMVREKHTEEMPVDLIY
jgi:hypothetical protein